MSALKNVPYLSEEQYLQNEMLSSVKHEYVDGQIYAMAGASEKHNLIAGNIFSSLRNARHSSGCRVFISDMKLRIADSYVYYPNVMLVCECGKDDDEYYKHQPCLIAEVLAKNTQATDEREKLINYQKIASLKYYLMVDSQEKQVHYLQRDDSGIWQTAVLEAGENLLVQCENYQSILTLDSIYEDVGL